MIVHQQKHPQCTLEVEELQEGTFLNVLFETQYGSRLYGTQTPTSDIDLIQIILPQIEDLLLGKKLEIKVKKTNNEKNLHNTKKDIDISKIPLQIFARHFVEGQTYAIELAFAIDGDHAAQCFHFRKNLFIPFVQELREKFLTSNIKAMMGYVVNQASLYSFKGERLNATRELIEIFDFVKANVGEEVCLLDVEYLYKPRFEDLATKYPKYFRKDLYDIGGDILKPCFIILGKTLPFTNSVSQTLKVLNALESKYGSRSDAASESNVDWKATMHALRIVDEGLQILSTHKLSFPFEPAYVERLLSIKRGELPLDPIKEELSMKLDQLKELEKTTDLPVCDTEFLKKFDAWMVEKLHTFYDLDDLEDFNLILKAKFEDTIL